MLGNHFYHQRIRKSVAVFGSLFNNIYVLRKNSAGAVTSQIKVPLSYGPSRKFLERIRENPDLDTNTKVAIKLPRMSFEILGIDYDAQRQLQKVNSIQGASAGTVYSRNKIFTPVPYNLNFQLNVYGKNQDDVLQIVEQIIPTFNPQYTLTIKPIEDYPDIKEDSPIILNGISFLDDYEGPLEQRRTIVYTLDFTMKVNFYNGFTANNIIRTANPTIGFQAGGTNDSDVNASLVSVVTDPALASPDSDYGVNITVTDLFGLDSA